MSLFSLPLHQWQQQQTILTSKKRKSPTDGFESSFPESGEDAAAKPLSPPPTSSQYKTIPATLSDPTQHRLAGLSPGKPIPCFPFPHAPSSHGQITRRQLINSEEVLQSLDPPLYLPDSFIRTGSLRMQHFAVISTILHRCLLKGDYIRASRAWGMMLRDEFGGHAIDPRTDGQWGIGAEILLHRGAQSALEQPAASPLQIDLNSTPRNAREATQDMWLTRPGFEAAKEYYERLILNYPYHISQAKATSALDFYPAMFGLWIYIVQAEANLIRSKANADRPSPDPSDRDENDEDWSLPDTAEQDNSREQELREAGEIAGRMDQIMGSPPYADYGELLRLRGMVALWIGDLQFKTDEEEGERKKRESLIFAKRQFEDARRRGIPLPASIEALLEGEGEDEDEDEDMDEGNG